MVTTKTPRVTGLFEAHLPVADVQRAIRFYREVVGLDVAYEVPDRGAALPWLAERNGAMPEALAAAGVAPLSFFGEPADEPSVIGWMPAAAVYFRDPDDHMLEYLAMLDEPPRPDAGITTWSDWVR